MKRGQAAIAYNGCMHPYGYVRVAAATPRLHLADVAANVAETLLLLEQAEARGVNLLVFPECHLTGYTCHDLFHHETLQRRVLIHLQHLIQEGSRRYRGVAVYGLPWAVDGQVFNVAVVVQGNEVLGIVPKSYLPTYKEFYDRRYFSAARHALRRTISWGGQEIPFGTDLLFCCRSWPELIFAVEICEDLWVPIPPSSGAALAGATILLNLSASNDLVGKAAYRRQLVLSQSGRCLAAYVYTSSGVGESSTDLLFGGHALIAENGTLLAESDRFSRTGGLTAADVDLQHLWHDRCQMTSFHDNRLAQLQEWRRIPFSLELSPRAPELLRAIDPQPFVPADPASRDERCREIFHLQVSALARRLEQIGAPPVAIGVSGGLDSTLALLVACKTVDLLKLPRRHVRALTMPGFGTTERTLSNARSLMEALGVAAQEIDIRELCLEQMRALGHAPFGIPLAGESVESFSDKLRRLPANRRYDLVFENVQARVRTSLLMNTGFVIGTGDMSELAVGWCTYNADHMSMYNVNVSVPKTLVRFLVRWAAEHEFQGNTRKILLDVADTVITPELLPPDASGNIVQLTEEVVGPYELIDFFLYHFLRYGTSPEKILYLARQARFSRLYSPEELKHWLRTFLKRFFAQQYKRSCLPDGPKVGTVSLSPRGDWRMPSDAAVQEWLAATEPI
ncbi:MAG: NAD(+) synthase [Gemmataceae bacterium]|nr:NAD(+) synthase [Gemmataceae bacterium]